MAEKDRFADQWEAAGKRPGWRANAVSAASIKPVAIRWLWPGWIAKGKLHILAGAGGTGKTTLLLGLIATITSAGRWPDGERCKEAGNAIIWSSEDDPADTIVPRLAAAGADLRRVHIIQGRINPQGEVEPFDPASDIDLLRETAEAIGGVSLLMLDPVVSAIKGDMHKANEVRRGLQCVVDFAEAHACAVVGVSHFAKGTAGGSPAERVVGSQAFSALARTVLVAAKQEDSDLRVLARAKSNISVDEGGVSYTIESATIETEHGPIETTRVLWGDKLEGSARDILGDVETTGEDGDRSELDEACDFLRELLADDPIPTKQVKAEASDAGYAWKTIRNARDAIGAKSFRKGEKGRKGGGNWYWSLRCPSDFGHLNNLDDGHLNQIQENQWFQPYSDDENELRCPSLGVGTLIENPVIGPDEEGI
ncbi:AAA family ATPase [Pseudomonas aeruginosa]|uniref:AAA family ATPase n=1 Tax=Pseudomonas aeruginosa TaxID=287 RepID=UPI0009A32C46|nr:AAA family ATPase [Pseudomonas aeruginosa]RCI50806.1 AAA family ATPase [Pseudomonas aeruginosa]RWX99579.1 AAA family ATPase [Pseudomonas aeruginosa]RWY15208.1 AAA family ATPase [Pseudomonas aeruginosa]RWY93499.1 AAA family ATPase [Pseudomonas aeruginosa]